MTIYQKPKDARPEHSTSTAPEELPVTAFLGDIKQMVRNSQVSVIVAETGAGKSTQVPKMLLEEGYRVIVTQPRRIAARTVAERVATELGEELGGRVGYRTGVDGQESPSSNLLFCTDGLALVREAVRLKNKGENCVLVLDEVHEMNLNMEILIAWARREIAAGAKFKLVLMSATLDRDKLCSFFSKENAPCPAIEVPGRLFPIETRTPQATLTQDVQELVAQGRNVLVFESGKREISDTISNLQACNLNAVVLPLHGELTPEEQKLCFRKYSRPKVIVATNVAQTSITIPDIDAVVDNGEERRTEVVDGVEGLYVRPISLADSKQRRGRAGRTKAGIYIDRCKEPHHQRASDPIPEVARVRLDQAVLRLAIQGLDMEQLPLLNQPKLGEIQRAKQTLIALGCLSSNGEVTEKGRLVARLPVSVNLGCMILEGQKRGVLESIVSIAALMEIGGITRRTGLWKQMCTGESTSDLLAQLKVLNTARAMQMSSHELMEKGIHVRSYFRVLELRRQIFKGLKHYEKGSNPAQADTDILKSICAGMIDHLFENQGETYDNGNDQRELDRFSVVSDAQWIVGTPFDLELPTKRGEKVVLELIKNATKVDPTWLAEIAPHLMRIESGALPHYDAARDECKSTTKIFFRERLIQISEKEDPTHPQAAELFAQWCWEQVYSNGSKRPASGSSATLEALKQLSARYHRLRALESRIGRSLSLFPSSESIRQRLIERLQGARSLKEVANPDALRFDLYSAEDEAAIVRDKPDSLQLSGKNIPLQYKEAGKKVSITLTRDQIVDDTWNQLASTVLSLPDGSPISVSVALNSYVTITAANSKEAAEKLRVHLLEQQQQRVSLPALAPLLSEDQVVAATIIRHHYGDCSLTGKPLWAYAAPAVDTNWRAGSTTSRYQMKWFWDEAQAIRSRDDSVLVAQQEQKIKRVELPRKQEAPQRANQGFTGIEESDLAQLFGGLATVTKRRRGVEGTF